MRVPETEPLAQRLSAFQREVSGCTRCHAQRLVYGGPEGTAYPLFQVAPTGAARVLVVAEAPNLADTFDPAKGRITYEADTDPTGVFACKLIASVGLRVEDVLFTNAVLCLPARKNGKHPVGARQIELCRPWLAQLIEVADPLVVVTFGARALASLNGLEKHSLALKAGVGKLHPWRGRWLLPLYHPGQLGRVTRRASQQLEDIAVLREYLAGRTSAGPNEPLASARQ